MRVRHYPSNRDPEHKALCGRPDYCANPTLRRYAYRYRPEGNPNRHGMCKDCLAVLNRWDDETPASDEVCVRCGQHGIGPCGCGFQQEGR